MGKDGEEQFWENNNEQDQEVAALCQCFQETKVKKHFGQRLQILLQRP